MELRMTPSAHRMCLWSGHMCTVLYLFGFIFLADFVFIPGPDAPADELAQWLFDRKTSFIAGCCMMIFAAAFMAPWGASLAIWTRKTESRFPVIYVTQIVCLAASTALFVLIEIFWALAAYRATEINPELTQAIYDAGWFVFLFIGPAFYMWVCSFGLGVLLNPPEHQMFPRWVGYYSLASVLCWVMGMMAMFFDFGPADYSGMLPTWIPLIEFFLWMEILTFYGLKAINKQEQICREEAGEGEGVYEVSWDDPLIENGAAMKTGVA